MPDKMWDKMWDRMSDKILDKMDEMPCDTWTFTEEGEPYCKPAKDLNRNN